MGGGENKQKTTHVKNDNVHGTSTHNDVLSLIWKINVLTEYNM